jgi:hypothetical protein
VAALVYSIWFARNQQVFDLRSIDSLTVIAQAHNSIQEYQKAMNNDAHNGSSRSHLNTNNNREHNRRPRANKWWTKPDHNKIKVNCDANLAIEGRWGLGAIYRNSDGALLVAATWVMPGENDPKLADTRRCCWRLNVATKR